MASTVETTTPRPAQDEGFDLLEFWIRHRSRILLYGVLLLVALIVFSAYEIAHQRSLAAAEGALAQAKTSADFQKVAAEYPTLPAGAAAQMMLADSLRKEGKLDDSSAALRAFIEKHPTHSLIAGAYTSLAANAETQGKLDDALATYKKVITLYPTSFAAPAAWMGQAHVLQQQGKIEEARHSFETLTTQFPDSPFREEAMRESQKLKK